MIQLFFIFFFFFHFCVRDVLQVESVWKYANECSTKYRPLVTLEELVKLVKLEELVKLVKRV